MIDDIVKVIVSVLIANDKMGEHPYLTSFTNSFSGSWFHFYKRLNK